MAADPFAESTVTPERLALGAFAVEAPTFAYLGHTLFADLLFGCLVGVVFGVGSLLYLPYLMRRAAVAEGEASPAAMGQGYRRRAAAGLALTIGGFVALSGRFVVEGELLRPLLVGGVVAALVFVPVDHALPPLSSLEDSR